MLLASGLGLGSSRADSMLGLQLLVDMVTGQLGDTAEQSGAATISRVLLAGNLLSQSTQEKDASTKVARQQTLRIHFILLEVNIFNSLNIRSLLLQAKYLTKKTQAGSVEAIRLLDELLLQLVVSRILINTGRSKNISNYFKVIYCVIVVLKLHVFSSCSL